MVEPLHNWILSAFLAAIVVAVAYRLRSLSAGGAVAAVLIGTIIVGTGGWWPGVILVVFFATSSLLSRSESAQARGSRRDWVQVLANGWGMLLGCVLFTFTGWEPWLLFGIGAIAAATADTWSSEIGRFSDSPPRLITNGMVVSPGTSGAITLLGTMASIAGAALIAMLTTLAVSIDSLPSELSVFIVFIGITLAGISGGMLDSFLGATVQEKRWCDTCEKSTEANPHICGTTTRHIGGIARVTNDVVNMLCVLTGALIGVVSGIL